MEVVFSRNLVELSEGVASLGSLYLFKQVAFDVAEGERTTRRVVLDEAVHGAVSVLILRDAFQVFSQSIATHHLFLVNQPTVSFLI